ncbi:hypothetical protein [Xanthomonas floridensis]|uniref:Uncharacterized protein n=1 Tax=Xanthomonas floridensis TaxID=1843580 RepID=A0A1A9MIF4_9XANT|nr:hypothetical protein [Xanthomonas floridensis]MEA5123485.1 hypothetical protein [Xanthomonas floridensis]MEA5130351.1 hypothetical protein [Xanthomonas floridensis]OAG69407.1 hypothetical protein A7D17_00900 [Xanthomonas floridensis]
MKESLQQEKMRRAISDNLTKRINDVGRYPQLRNVRSAAVQALGILQDRITALCMEFQEKFPLRADQPLAYFYIKGGNAFKACMDNLRGNNRELFDSGDSDWDTQIVIDPWLPGPIQAALQASIEEIVLEEMRNAGIHIATEIALISPPEDSPLTPYVYVDPVGEPRQPGTGVAYLMQCDEPQMLRRIFDGERIGLSTDVSRTIGDDRTPPSAAQPDLVPNQKLSIPGISLNDAIKPFILYRLGYTWHGTQFERAVDHIIDRPASPRGILMELIDVSLPRRDAIETIAIWSEIGRRHLTILTAGGSEERWQLPLPDLDYHLRENLWMLCEIACDPNGPGAHKEAKRRERVATIRAWYDTNSQLPHFQAVLDGMAGTRVGAPGNDAATLVDAMMASVRARTVGAAPDYAHGQPTSATRDRVLAARHGTRTMIDLLASAFTTPAMLSAAFSDDLLLMSTLAQNPYLAIAQLRFSGVDMAALVRVSHQALLSLDTTAFAQALGRWLGEDVQVLAQPHNTPRVGGLSYECTLVVYLDQKKPPFDRKVLAFLTLTTATDAQAPFHSNAADPGNAYAALLDIDSQRKAAAAVIDEFVLRYLLSKQHEAIKMVLPQA